MFLLERWMERLLKKILDRKVRVAVIGLGYVGLPLVVEMGRVGIHVLGYDVDVRKIEQLKAGKSYVGDIPSSDVRALIEEGLFEPSADKSILSSADAVVICVPTPLNKTKDPDISYVMQAAEDVAAFLKPSTLIVLESTTYPGTTRDLVLPLFEAKDMVVGEDFCLCFSPERVDPGNQTWTIHNTPKLMGGVTQTCTSIGQALYGLFVQRVVPVSSTEVAETAKLLENTFRAVNIALVNELAIMCHKLGVDVWEAIEAAASKPFGFMPFFPGPGLGGHCIPVDPHYLRWALKSLNYNARFIELASEINASMPAYVVDRVGSALNEAGKPFNGSKVLVLGVAYKPDISDTRESPALDLLVLLSERHTDVSYFDPFVSELTVGERHFSSIDFEGTDLSLYDCAVIVTNHSGIDYDRVARQIPLVIDTRNATKNLTRSAQNIRKL